jgi:hypothetical protein
VGLRRFIRGDVHATIVPGRRDAGLRHTNSRSRSRVVNRNLDTYLLCSKSRAAVGDAAVTREIPHKAGYVRCEYEQRRSYHCQNQQCAEAEAHGLLVRPGRKNGRLVCQIELLQNDRCLVEGPKKAFSFDLPVVLACSKRRRKDWRPNCQQDQQRAEAVTQTTSQCVSSKIRLLIAVV